MRLSVRYIGMGSLMLATALGVPVTHAEVYKWVDEHGVVNYAETPNPGQNAEKMGVETATKSGTQAEEAQQAAETKDADTPAAQSEGDEKYQENLEKLKQSCVSARRNLGLLKSDVPARTEVDGRVVTLSLEQRKAEIGKWEKYIQESCSGLE